MPSRKCYVLMYKDYDGDIFIRGVYASYDAVNNIIRNNNLAGNLAEQWDEETANYPPIDLPERPKFAALHRPPSNTTSKEYLEWLTEKLNFHDADSKWMAMRVNLQEDRRNAIKAKFGERPVYYKNLYMEEVDFHE